MGAPKTRVVVAMSGGVDSSVAALVLKNEGYDVVGMALQVTDYSKYHKEGSKGTCCSIKDMEDARRVAEALEIPFYVINTEETFDRNVVQYFVEEYQEGRTPNPCVMCNTRVKFNHLYRKALDLGADYVATGHFAKVSYDEEYGYCLWRGDDGQKDQSYFLFNLTQEQLKRTLFPLGEMNKSEVRELARQNNLPVAEKAESQEICFVPNNDYAKFINDYSSESPLAPFGKIVSKSGVLLGRHNGIHNYTIGQRKRISEALNQAQKLKLPDVSEYRVVEIDPQKNEVILGTLKDLEQNALKLNKVNWIVDPAKLEGRSLKVKIRYRSQSAEAQVKVLPGNRARVNFLQNQRSITPGQACVIFHGDLCVGGGWIESAVSGRTESLD